MPRQKAIPPTITHENGSLGTKKTHPAFGMLRFSRVSGDPGKLFGSEISHNSFIRMTLSPGEEHWTNAQSWFHGRSQVLVEVDLSAAQFAELITSLNMGSGVPCTIRRIHGTDGERPEIEDKSTYHEQIQTELRKEAADALSDVKKLAKTLDDTLTKSKLSKTQQNELNCLMNRITGSVESSMPFILEQYQEGAEKIGAKAKAELDAWATSLITALGKDALAKLQAEVALPAPTTNDSIAQ